MELVKELEEIIENIETIDKYLEDLARQEFAIRLIKEATCFVAVKKEKGYNFYPSRFIGYRNNSYEAYTKHEIELGKDASARISEILKHKPDASKDIENEYKNYCKKLGFTARDKGKVGEEHRYWVIAIS